MKPNLRLFPGGVSLRRLVAQTESFPGGPAIQRVPAQSGIGRAAAVRVADSGLVFSGQVVAPGLGGDARPGAEASRHALGSGLARHASGRERVVRRRV
jgi:hypothetical protein